VLILRRALFAALLASTALTPTPAKATGVEAFLLGFAGAGATTGAVASALGVGGLFQAGAFLGTTLIGQTLLSLGVSAALNALTPRAQPPEPSARLLNYAQPVSYAEWPVGRTRKGGPLGFTAFNGGKRYYSVILAAAPVGGVVTHYLDDREATINGSGIVQTAPMTDLGYINFQNGDSNTADSTLVATFPEITSFHDFDGLAVAHLWAKRPKPEDFSEVYPNGREWNYSPLIDGVKVYDPRTATTAHSRNLALNTAYWLTTILGRVIPTTHAWWNMVAGQADVCDETVTNGEGGTQAKWQLDGVFSDDEEFEQQRSKVALAGDVWFYERSDGLPGFKVGKYEEPTVTLTESNFLQFSMSEGFWGRNAPTEISPQYVEPSQKWREAPAGTLVLDATTRQVKDEPTLFMVASHNQACRCAKRFAAVKRADYKIKATVGFEGYDLIGERFVRIQALGKDIVCEIQELYRNEGGHTFDLVGQSVNASDFDYVAAIEEPARPTFDQVVSENTVDPVTGLTGTAADGGEIKYQWNAADASLSQELRIKRSTEADWTVIPITSGQSTYTVNGLTDGQTYQAQIRNVTGTRRPSAWSSMISVAAVENSTAPVVLTAFATSESAGTVTVNFTAPNDANYFATRIYRAGYSAGYSGPYSIDSASVIRTEYGIPSGDDSYDDIGLSTGHYAYWGAPINASGVEGTASGPQTEDVA